MKAKKALMWAGAAVAALMIYRAVKRSSTVAKNDTTTVGKTGQALSSAPLDKAGTLSAATDVRSSVPGALRTVPTNVGVSPKLPTIYDV